MTIRGEEVFYYTKFGLFGTFFLGAGSGLLGGESELSGC